MIPIYKSAFQQKKAYRIMDKHLNDLLEDYGLNATEWVVLGLIADDPTINLVDIAKELNFEKAHITNLSNSLTMNGFITRKRSELDKREQKLQITKAGQELLEKLDDRVRSEMRLILFGVKPEELQTYRKVLQLIIDNEEKIQNSAL